MMAPFRAAAIAAALTTLAVGAGTGRAAVASRSHRHSLRLVAAATAKMQGSIDTSRQDPRSGRATAEPAMDLDLDIVRRTVVGVAACMKARGYDYTYHLPGVAESGAAYLAAATDAISGYFDRLDGRAKVDFTAALGDLEHPGCGHDQLSGSDSEARSVSAAARADALLLRSSQAFRSAEGSWRQCLARRGITGATSLDRFSALITTHRNEGEDDAWESRTRSASRQCLRSSGYGAQMQAIRDQIRAEVRRHHPRFDIETDRGVSE